MFKYAFFCLISRFVFLMENESKKKDLALIHQENLLILIRFVSHRPNLNLKHISLCSGELSTVFEIECEDENGSCSFIMKVCDLV